MTDLLTSRTGARLPGQPPVGVFPQRNLYRQIDVPFAARLGGVLQVDAYMADGRSGSLRGAFPFAAASLVTPLRLGGLGLWQLGPAVVALPSFGVTGSYASATYALPKAASFGLVELYVQALLVPTDDPATWRLSNAVRFAVQ